MTDSILFQFFCQLYQQGIPLGTADYLLAVEALGTGLGLEDLEQFKRLLQLLWVKSREEREIFDRAFAEIVKPRLKPTPIALREEIELFKQQPSKVEETPPPTPPEPKEKPELPDIPKPTPSPSPEPPTPPHSPEPPTPPPEVKRSLTLAQEVVKMGFEERRTKSPPWKPDLLETSHHYQLTPRLPLSLREMTEIWRQLRQIQRLGRPEELDIGATVDNICRTGFLLRPVLRPRRRNLVRLVVLVDCLGSMAPFALVVEALCQSIVRSGLLGKVSFYYFHDCPEEYLYESPSLTGAIPREKVLAERAQGNSVLIVSDAGSAYGYYDKPRLKATRAFLTELKTYTYCCAWLNPLPQGRWTATTAREIAEVVPMFPLSLEGLQDTINILRGRPPRLESVR